MVANLSIKDALFDRLTFFKLHRRHLARGHSLASQVDSGNPSEDERFKGGRALPTHG